MKHKTNRDWDNFNATCYLVTAFDFCCIIVQWRLVACCVSKLEILHNFKAWHNTGKPALGALVAESCSLSPLDGTSA